MEMNHFREEPHVAQRSRRDKLRVHQQPNSEHLENYYSKNLEQLSVHDALSPELIRLRNVNYGTVTYDSLTAFSPQEDPSNDVTIARTSGDWNVSSTYNFCNATSTHDQSNQSNSNFASSSLYTRQPSRYDYQDYPLGQTSTIHQNIEKSFGEVQQYFTSSSFLDYQTSLQGVVTSATNQGSHTSFGDYQSSHFRGGSITSADRSLEAFPHWDGECLANPRSLSLWLSSVPESRSCKGLYGEGIDLINPLDSKTLIKSNYLGSSSRVITQSIHNAAGPLGPFTGYSTILKNSKYLKPALQLLDELFSIPDSKKHIKTCEGLYSDEFSELVEDVARDVVSVAMVGAKVGKSVISSSTFYSSNEISREAGGGSISSEYCNGPEYHQKKASLLYMQEEVCRRYKQYHHQMQMVVSSFESVAGLRASTPYISMAVTTMLRHFCCIKSAISDQLKHMEKEAIEGLSFHATGTNDSGKGETSNLQLKIDELGLQKNFGGSKLIMFESQQSVWKPQRGLPEHAVAVLRAWLFDHFLHPYPTDIDKHTLATQTGLTRNQVSNWFINARVRIWKPMVEEIHLLETAGLADQSSKRAGKTNENPGFENANHHYENQATNNLSGIDSLGSKGLTASNQIIPGTIDQSSLMSFLPCQQAGGLEIGAAGHGAVSLTLGLTQSAESVHQQQHQQLQQQEHYQKHYGGQMLYDFVG